MSESQTIENIRRILKEEMIPEMVTFRIEREIDKYDLPQRIRSCQSCALHDQCYQHVPGHGPIPADLMFVGEAPGQQEDTEGTPFVGPAGQLLNRMIEAAGWKREDIYVTNVIKCRPEANRNPTKAEVAACYNHLKKEIELVNPKVIMCWGSIAANTLIHPDFKITQEHGSWFEDGGIRKIALFHPAYILRLGDGSAQQKQAKARVWQALRKVMNYKNNGWKDELGG